MIKNQLQDLIKNFNILEKRLGPFLVLIIFLPFSLNLMSIVQKSVNNYYLIENTKFIIGSMEPILHKYLYENKTIEISEIPLTVRFDTDKTIGVSNEYKRLTYFLGYNEFLQGNYESAIRYLNSLEEKDHLYVLAYFLNGVSNLKLGYKEEAIELWKSSPEIKYYFLYTGSQAEWQGDYEKAEASYEIANQLFKGDLNVTSGYLYLKVINALGKGNFEEESIETITNQALEYNTDNYSRLLKMGVDLFNNGYYDLSVRSLSLSLKVNATDQHWPYYYLGKVYYYKGNLELAESYFREALMRDSDFGRGYQWLARTALKLGKNREALNYYQEALKLLPGDENLYKEYRRVYETQ